MNPPNTNPATVPSTNTLLIQSKGRYTTSTDLTTKVSQWNEVRQTMRIHQC